MRNPVLEQLDALVGEWRLTLTDCWCLESLEAEQHGHATIAWVGEAFITLAAEMEGEHIWDFVFGRSDVNDRLVALYHDPRPTSRLFEMTYGDGAWTMHREDPDMHQRFIAEVSADRVAGRWEASDDAGKTWRKDFDLFFDRGT